MSEFKVGDLVRLKSDAKVMVVGSLYEAYERPGEPGVEVVYRDNEGSIRSTIVPPWVLQPHEKNPKVKKP